MNIASIDHSKCDVSACVEIPDSLDTPCWDACKLRALDIAPVNNGIKAAIYTLQEDADFYETMPCNGCGECIPTCPLEAITLRDNQTIILDSNFPVKIDGNGAHWTGRYKRTTDAADPAPATPHMLTDLVQCPALEINIFTRLCRTIQQEKFSESFFQCEQCPNKVGA